MNREEAKLILHAYRPCGRDATDPHFAAALALAKKDPELAAWFARQQKFDGQCSQGIRDVRAPSRLKAEILALHQSKPSVVKTWWQNLFSWQYSPAWASVIALFIGVSVVVLRHQTGDAPNDFAAYSVQMVNAATHDKHHVDTEVPGTPEAIAWLASHQGETNLVVPVALGGDSQSMGCRVLAWHGQKVSMVCLSVKGMFHVDVFVTGAQAFPNAPTQDRPQFAMRGGLPTASWTKDGNVYLAVGHSSDAAFKNLLPAI